MVYRIFPLVILLVAAPFAASAQVGGIPGLPGGLPGPVPGGFGSPLGGPPLDCQQLVTLRDETQEQWETIEKAKQRNAPVQEACRLFRSFLIAETKFKNEVDEHGGRC